MPMYAKLDWIIECDNCPIRYKTEPIYGSEFGVGDDEQDQPRIDYLLEIELHSDWEIWRESYESHGFLCPDCVKKRERQKRKLAETSAETRGA